jgi:hypothetical protein
MTYVFLVFVFNNKLCNIYTTQEQVSNWKEWPHKAKYLSECGFEGQQKVYVPNSNIFPYAPLHMEHKDMKHAIGTK